MNLAHHLRVRCGALFALILILFSKPVFSTTADLSTLTATASTAVLNGAPKQIRVGADGKIYVLGTSTSGLVQISSDGTTASTITYDNALTSHSSADFVITGSTLYIVVANGTTSAPIYRYDISGSTASLVSSVGTTATGTTSVTLGTDGTVYNNRSTTLKGYTADLSTNTSSSAMTAALSRSMINSSGVLYYISAAGALRRSTDYTSSTDTLVLSTGLTTPLGISVSSDGTAYVANASNIKKINSSGTTLWTKSVSTLSGMTVDSTGRIFWVNTSGTVTVLSPINSVSSFSGTPHSTSVDLSWTNGTTDSDFSGVTIRRSTSSYPTSATDGTAVTSNDTGSSFSDTGLSAGTTYYYTIFNKTVDGYYSVGLPYSTTTAPATPSLSVAKPTLNGSTINISWDVPSGTNTFRLTRNIDGAGETTINGAIPNSTTSYSDTGLIDASYVYKIYAINSLSSESSAGTSSTITIDTTAPAAPTISAAKPSPTSSSIDLSWDVPSTTDTFRLIRSYNSGATTTINASIPNSTTNLTQSSLGDGTYVYTIYASDSFGNESSAGTSSTITIDTTAPSAPTGFSASASGSSIHLDWTNPTVDFDSVTIRVSTSSYPALISSGSAVLTDSSLTTTTQSGLSDGTYYYSIFAKDTFGNVSVAANVTATVDTTAPSSPTITGTKPNLTANSIDLSWDVPATTDTFKLTRIYNGGSEVIVNNSIANSTTSLSQSSLADGTYVYKIYARDNAGNLSNAGVSSTVTIDTTAPSAPSSVSAEVSGSNVTLHWTNPIDADFSSITIRRDISGFPTTITEGTLVAESIVSTSQENTSLSNETYKYSLFAIDTFGNISTAAHVTVVVNVMPTPSPEDTPGDTPPTEDPSDAPPSEIPTDNPSDQPTNQPVDEPVETPASTATVSTTSATSLDTSSAVLGGRITNVGAPTPTVRGFEYGETNQYGSSTQEMGSFEIGDFTAEITDLTCGTTYHYRAYATNETGTAYGDDTTFSTDDCTSNLILEVESPTGSLEINSNAIFVVTADNPGNTDENNVVIGFTLSDNLEFVSAERVETSSALKLKSLESLSCTGHSTITCDVGTIAANTSVSLNITTIVKTEGAVTLEAFVSSDSGESETIVGGGNDGGSGVAIDHRSSTGANSFGCELNPETDLNKNSKNSQLIIILGLITLIFIKRIKKIFFLSLIALFLFTSTVQATTNRFSIIPHFAFQKGDWIATPSSFVLEKDTWNFSQVMSYDYHSLELSLAGVRVSGVVDDLLTQQLSAGYGFTDRFTMEATLPIIWWNRFTNPTSGITSDKVRLGDLSLQARYRFLDRDDEIFGLSLVPFLTIPTGSEATFSGDKFPTAGFRVVADKNFGEKLALGAHLGTRFRQKAVFFDYDSASQFLMGAAGSFKVGKGFFVKAEILSQTAFNDFYQNKANSPVQWLLGIDKNFGNTGWSASIGTSLNLVRGSGTPLIGTFLGVSYNSQRSSQLRPDPFMKPDISIPHSRQKHYR